MAEPRIVKGAYLLDGQTVYRAICPECNRERILDEDQFLGRISMECDCGYHETHNMEGALRKFKAQEQTLEEIGKRERW